MNNRELFHSFFKIIFYKFKVYRIWISSTENLAIASLTTKKQQQPLNSKVAKRKFNCPPSKKRPVGVPSDKLSIPLFNQSTKAFSTNTGQPFPKNCVLFFVLCFFFLCKSVGSCGTQSNKRQSISMTGSAPTNNCFLLPLTNVLGARADVCVVIRSDGEGTSALPKVPPDLM